MPSKKFIFFLCMYKMFQISKEGYKKWEVEIIYKDKKDAKKDTFG